MAGGDDTVIVVLILAYADGETLASAMRLDNTRSHRCQQASAPQPSSPTS